MGWGERRRDGSTRPPPELYAAAAVAAGQLPVVWLVWWFGEQSGDTYGRGFNSMGIACVLVFAPLVLPVLGLLHALAQSCRPVAWPGSSSHARVGRAGPGIRRAAY